jgi:Fe-S-cluster containining protein
MTAARPRIASARRPRSTPLLFRPGARFRCAGDGLCCTDVHAVGPLGPKDRRFLRALDPDVVVWNPAAKAHVLETKGDGRCVFLGEAGCAIHASLGEAAKPRGCRRFPIGLTATPDGGRVTTEHRCPCRTLGDRPPLDPEAARAALQDDRGRLRPDHRVGDRLPTTRRSTVSWSTWRRREEGILDALQAGGRIPEALGADPFPALEVGTWPQLAAELLDLAAGGRTRFHAALAWAGWALAPTEMRRRVTAPPRPWADVFDRAEARTSADTAEAPEVMLRDFLADEVWNLRWAARRPYREAAADLATRAELATRLARTGSRRGRRPDLAMAEALTVVELLGASDLWGSALDRIARSA